MKDLLTFPDSRGRIRTALASSAEMLLLVAALGGILLTRPHSYLLFHSVAEIFSIAVAVGVFIVAWNSDSLVKNGYLLILGVGSLFIAILDTVHTLAYKGMGVFPGTDANLATQLWLAARYLQALTWLAAPFFIRRPARRDATTASYALVTAALLASIFLWRLFPAAYVDGIGLTPFKIYSEYVIIAVLVVAMGLLWRQRSQFEPDILRWLLASLLAALVSEFMFTLYAGVTDSANLFGHVFKIIEFYLLYRALVQTGFTRPYGLILRQMKQQDEAEVAQERHRAEIRAAELDAMFSSMTDGAVLYAPDGAILRKNDATDQLFGWTQVSPGLPMAQRAKIHSFVTEDGEPVELRDLPAPRALRGEEVHDVVLGAPSARTGEIRWMAFSAAPVRDGDGEPHGAVLTFRDITERKRAEEEVQRLNEELEWRIKDRTGQLEAANQELESFAYSVSHDLRAPLRHIDGFIGLLQKQTRGALDEKSRHYMDLIAQSAKQMGELIDDLLQFSRMGRTEMFQTDVDLSRLVDEVIGLLKPDARGRQVEWQVAPLPCVFGDRAMLRIAFVNLLANSLKFTAPRPVAKIEVGCCCDNPEEIVIFIRDNGVGFDMNYADKLFGVFQRLHRADEFEGTGIGLANVQRIISRHGGRTWAEGKVGEGATFYFSLPRAV